MSNQNRKNKIAHHAFSGHNLTDETNALKVKDLHSAENSAPAGQKKRFRKTLKFLKTHLFAIGVIGFVAVGVLGAGLKFLEDAAKSELAHRGAQKNRLNEQRESFLNKLNPFLPAPLPSPEPQLAKEYIYAGSRPLAVEDVNAAQLPPADLAVWRPTTGVWWVMGGSGSQQFSQSWGQNSDVPAPGDYDGDGKTDLCIFRPSTSTWWIVKSSGNSHYSVTFGTAGDEIAQADYDGDGKTDIAVFRPSNGNWYINQSSNGIAVQGQFGLSTDKPTPGDYDGDGRADLAVWRASNSTFYSRNSSDALLQSYAFAQSGANPVPADYDGDGKADFAIRESNSPNWIIRRSVSGQIQTINWGQSTDTEVRNDYDGDGRVDLAVWRESNGTWYIRQSGANGALRQQQWGMSGDKPVPAFYRR